MGGICSVEDDGAKPPDLKKRAKPALSNPHEPSPVSYCGTLSKREDNLEALSVADGFRHRICTLKHGLLAIRKGPHEEPIQQILMEGAELRYDETKAQILLQSVVQGEKTARLLCFQCESPEEASAWVGAMADSIHANKPRALHPIENVGFAHDRCSWHSATLAW